MNNNSGIRMVNLGPCHKVIDMLSRLYCHTVYCHVDIAVVSSLSYSLDCHYCRVTLIALPCQCIFVAAIFNCMIVIKLVMPLLPFHCGVVVMKSCTLADFGLLLSSNVSAQQAAFNELLFGSEWRSIDFLCCFGLGFNFRPVEFVSLEVFFFFIADLSFHKLRIGLRIRLRIRLRLRY